MTLRHNLSLLVDLVLLVFSVLFQLIVEFILDYSQLLLEFDVGFSESLKMLIVRLN